MILMCGICGVCHLALIAFSISLASYFISIYLPFFERKLLL